MNPLGYCHQPPRDWKGNGLIEVLVTRSQVLGSTRCSLLHQPPSPVILPLTPGQIDLKLRLDLLQGSYSALNSYK